MDAKATFSARITTDEDAAGSAMASCPVLSMVPAVAQAVKAAWRPSRNSDRYGLVASILDLDLLMKDRRGFGTPAVLPNGWTVPILMKRRFWFELPCLG
jgi:hypothetical protein